MNWFTPINENAFDDLIERLPERLRLNGRSLLTEILFRTRRAAGWFDGSELKRGQFVYGEEKLGAQCYLSRQQILTLMEWFKKVGFLTIKSTKSGSIGSLIEIDTYINDKPENNRPSNQQVTNSQPTGNHILKDKGVKGKRKKAYTLQNPTGAEQALRCWTDQADLPKSANEEKCLKVLDDLHRIDQVPWEDAAGINAICKYAAKEWVPEGYIGSPMALRKPTQAGDMKKFEAIQQQIGAKRSQTPTNGRSQRPTYRLAYATGEPVTDPTKRLRRIVKNGEETDPDPGNEWTISDDVIAQAKADSIEAAIQCHEQTTGADHAV